MSSLDFSQNFLSICLSAAVPLNIMTIERRGGPSNNDFDRIGNFADVLCEKADVLLFGGGKKDEVAHLFNELAFSLAILSFCPGGVYAFGQHWEGKVVQERDEWTVLRKKLENILSSLKNFSS